MTIKYRNLIILGAILILSSLIVCAMGKSFFSWPSVIFASNASSCQSFPQELFLEEAESLKASSDMCWWVDSGAVFLIHNGVGETQIGPLHHGSPWRQLYAASDPIDTENGSYPQNIFRLINKVPRQNFYNELFFNIRSYRASESPGRNESNGILLMGRYVDADNLYYAGLRVDGTAVIKRKLDGGYETLGTVVLNNETNYDREKNPNMLPLDQWIGLSMNIANDTDKKVVIRLSLYSQGAWQTVLTVVDDPSKLPNGNILAEAANTGIRTDFMDIAFKNYKIISLK